MQPKRFITKIFSKTSIIVVSLRIKHPMSFPFFIALYTTHLLLRIGLLLRFALIVTKLTKTYLISGGLFLVLVTQN